MTETRPEPSPLTEEQLRWMENPVGGSQLMYAAAHEIRVMRKVLVELRRAIDYHERGDGSSL